MAKFVVKNGNELSVVKAKGFTPKNVIARLPGNIAEDDEPYIQVVQAVNDQGLPYWNVTVDTAAKAAAQADLQDKIDKENAKKNKKNTIQAKAEEVFPGVDAGELVLKAEMWRLMSAKAQSFKDLGLKTVEQVNAADDTELFSPGSALDTVQKIKNYADRKLELYEDFLVAKALAEQVYEDAVSGS